MNIFHPQNRRSDVSVNPHALDLPSNFSLPLVSVIIVNYNYGRYLAEAVESVFVQTYPNIECIIVDNASTDETPAVLDAITERYPQVIVIKRDINDGQTAASLDGFAQATGQYLIFLDADDVLLPRCVETHVYVHLSSRIHIGFTAGDMVQAINGTIVVSTGEAMNAYIRSGRGRRPDIWRSFNASAAWPPANIGQNLGAKAHYVPVLCTKWVWAPTSGLCYRRDALSLFADNEHLRGLWTATDMYFAHGIGAWCGSILIDEPVFIYRLHGSNLFSQTAQLHHTLNYCAGGSGDYNDAAKALIVDQLISHCERFSQNLLFKLHLVVMLFGLNIRQKDETLPRWAKRSSVAHRLVLYFDQFASRFGRRTTRLLMMLFGVPLAVIWRCGSGCRGSRAAQGYGSDVAPPKD
jgi:glycosyltransferase involved in cell wall biosynthesis